MSDRELLKTALTPTPDCLSVEQLEGLAESAEQSHPHVKQCPRCQTELALLRSFESSMPLPDEGAAVTWISSQVERRLPFKADQRRGEARASWWERVLGRGRAGVLVPAAAVLALTVATVLLLRPAKEPDLRADLGNHAPVFRSQQVELVGPSGELQQAPTILKWRAYPGADSYKVSVLEIDKTSVWTSNSKQTQISIPESLRAMMPAGKPLLWQVTGLDPHGNPIATSQFSRFSVSRKNKD